VHGDAAEEPALAVEEVAVGSVGVEQVGELVREPLEDHGKVELAAERVRGSKERRLLGEPLLVLRSSSATPARNRSSATAASEASVCMSERSSAEKTRRSSAVAMEMTAITRCSSRSGTNAALFAPVSSTSLRLTTFDSAASYTAKADASKTALATPDGSFARSSRISRHQSTSLPRERAR
jgi:hypothetical protein